MACFIPSLTIGLLLTLAASSSESVRKLSDLATMMLGGAILLAIKHVVVGEPLIPLGLSDFIVDVLGVGVPMVFAVTAVWAGLTVAGRSLALGESLKKAFGSPIVKIPVLSLIALTVMLVVDFVIGGIILGL